MNVTTLIQPSKKLSMMVLSWGLLHGLMGVFIAVSMMSRYPLVERFFVAALCVAVAIGGTLRFFRKRRIFKVNVSSDGKMRIAMVAANVAATDTLHQAVLLTRSTLWARMLLLRCRLETGHRLMIPVLPDSVSDADFRSLSVACRCHGRSSSSEFLSR